MAKAFTGRTRIRKTFGRIFKEEIKSEGIELKDENERVNGKLVLTSLSVDNGWAAGAWKYVPLTSPSPTADPSPSPIAGSSSPTLAPEFQPVVFLDY